MSSTSAFGLTEIRTIPPLCPSTLWSSSSSVKLPSKTGSGGINSNSLGGGGRERGPSATGPLMSSNSLGGRTSGTGTMGLSGSSSSASLTIVPLPSVKSRSCDVCLFTSRSSATNFTSLSSALLLKTSSKFVISTDVSVLVGDSNSSSPDVSDLEGDTKALPFVAPDAAGLPSSFKLEEGGGGKLNTTASGKDPRRPSTGDCRTTRTLPPSSRE